MPATEPDIPAAAPILDRPAAPLRPEFQPPRARGAVRLRTQPGPRGTALAELRQSGSLKCLFPRGDGFEAMLINTAGGITGGDRFDIEAAAAEGTELTLTTQAAERAYAATGGQAGRLRSRLEVDEGARLNWLPQETILFRGCDLDRSLTVDLAGSARFLMVEPLVFGRAAMGEVLDRGALQDHVQITRAGRPLFADRSRLSGDIAAHLARPFVANGAGAMALMVYVGPEAEAHLDPLRAMLPASGGVSLVQPDVLVLRLLAEDSHALRQTLVPVLTRFTPLPRCWSL